MKDRFPNWGGGTGEDMTTLSMYDSSYWHCIFEDFVCYMHYADRCTLYCDTRDVPSSIVSSHRLSDDRLESIE